MDCPGFETHAPLEVSCDDCGKATTSVIGGKPVLCDECVKAWHRAREHLANRAHREMQACVQRIRAGNERPGDREWLHKHHSDPKRALQLIEQKQDRGAYDSDGRERDARRRSRNI